MKKLDVILLITAITLLSLSVMGQEKKTGTVLDSIKLKADKKSNDSLMQHALKVHLNLDNCYDGCDYSYIRKEINFVNYVTELYESQLDIIIISNTTGSGGNEYTMIFNGKKEFKKLNDTVKISTGVNNTTDENRKEIVKTLKLALMRYVMLTPVKNMLSLNFDNPGLSNENVTDKWKNWVYSISGNGYANGEKTSKQYNFYSYLSAKKITPDWKFKFSLSSNYSENKYDVGDRIISSYNRSYYFSHSTIKSLTGHWSAGVYYDLSNSTYSNQKLVNSLSAGMEYDVFPYSESTSKIFTFKYMLGLSHNIYNDTTIYNKIREVLASESISANLSYIKGWGSVSSYIAYSNYLKDFKKNNLYVSGSVNVRLFKGFSFNTYLSYSFIHNQMGLPKEGATLEEVLLRQKELATEYSFYVSFGLSYTFGSILNNVVNPRFDY